MAEEKKSTTKKAHTDEIKVHLKKSEYAQSVGRRKTSVARVRLSKLESTEKEPFTVNNRSLTQYFPSGVHRRLILSPLERLGVDKTFKVSVKVVGGGIASQAQAVRHGISRALVAVDGEFRKKLKKYGFLTRDPRMVERKKYGLKKARKSPQWSKR